MSSNINEESRPEFTAVFSDDIRQEVGGKMTVVGIYNVELILPELPAFHPKLGVYIIGKVHQAEIKSLKIIIERNDDILLEAPVPRPTDTTDGRHQKGQDPRTNVRLFTAAAVLPPLTFTEPCTIRAKVEFNGAMYVAGRLHVSRAEPDDK